MAFRGAPSIRLPVKMTNSGQQQPSSRPQSSQRSAPLGGSGGTTLLGGGDPIFSLSGGAGGSSSSGAPRRQMSFPAPRPTPPSASSRRPPSGVGGSSGQTTRPSTVPYNNTSGSGTASSNRGSFVEALRTTLASATLLSSQQQQQQQPQEQTNSPHVVMPNQHSAGFELPPRSSRKPLSAIRRGLTSSSGRHQPKQQPQQQQPRSARRFKLGTTNSLEEHAPSTPLASSDVGGNSDVRALLASLGCHTRVFATVGSETARAPSSSTYTLPDPHQPDTKMPPTHQHPLEREPNVFPINRPGSGMMADGITKSNNNNMAMTPDECKRQGNAYYEKGKYREALFMYTRAVEGDSANVTYFTNRAAAHLMLGDYDSCVQDCLHALTLDVNSVKAHTRMARAYMLLGQLKMSRRHYDAALRLGSLTTVQQEQIESDSQALQLLEDHRRQFDACNFRVAMTHINNAHALIQDVPVELLRLHTLIHIIPSDARAQLSQHLDDVKQNPTTSKFSSNVAELLHLMAKACFYCGNHYIDLATSYAKQAVALRADMKQGHYLMKTIAFVDKRIGEAHQFYQASRWSEAAACYTLAATADPLNTRLRSVLYSNRAAANFNLGNLSEAVKDCTLSTDADPTNAKAFARRSQVYAALGDNVKALLDMETAAGIQESYLDELVELRARITAEKETAYNTNNNEFNQQPPSYPLSSWSSTYYDILGLDRYASTRDVRRRYRELTLQCHPDKCVNKPPEERARLEEQFKEITRCYMTLSDAKLRSDYDLTLPPPPSTTTTATNNNSYSSYFFTTRSFSDMMDETNNNNNNNSFRGNWFYNYNSGSNSSSRSFNDIKTQRNSGYRPPRSAPTSMFV
eukprot:PhM_4_TR14417/c0_g2_i1/m.18390/K09527/DNAJC7; DnaJ homolog subfamily C member 7